MKRKAAALPNPLRIHEIDEDNVAQLEAVKQGHEESLHERGHSALHSTPYSRTLSHSDLNTINRSQKHVMPQHGNIGPFNETRHSGFEPPNPVPPTPATDLNGPATPFPGKPNFLTASLVNPMI